MKRDKENKCNSSGQRSHKLELDKNALYKTYRIAIITEAKQNVHSLLLSFVSNKLFSYWFA